MRSFSTFFREAGWSVSSRIAQALASVVNTAILVRYVGPDALGLLITIWSTLLWGNLFNLGITGALVNRLTAYAAQEQEESYLREFGTGVALIAGIALVLGAGLLAAIFVLPLARIFPTGDPALARAVPEILGIGVAAFVAMFVAGCCYPDFAARGQLKRYYQINTASSVVGCGAVLLACWARQPLWVCAVALMVAGNILALLATIWVVSFSRVARALRHVTWEAVKALFANAKTFFLIQVSAIALFSSDAFIIAQAQSLSEVTLYSSINRLFLLGFTLAGGVIAPLYPALRAAVVRQEWNWVTHVFRRMSLSALAVLATLMLVGFWPMPEVARLWLGLPAAAPWVLCVLLGAATGMRLICDVQGQLLLAAERMRVLSVLAVLTPLIYVLLAILLVHRVGIVGMPVSALVAFGLNVSISWGGVQRVLRQIRIA
jgi:O-antigen/teichoic acid export membrane protein